MPFSLHTSNNLETLARQLGAELAAHRRAGGDPFRPATIVINSRGMESWLLQQLAATGVQANLRFVTPNELVNFLLLHLDGGSHSWNETDKPVDPYDRSVLGWRIYRLLGQLPSGAAFEPLRTYLSTAADPDRSRFYLANEIADVYDQYEILRPDMLADWTQGVHSDASCDLFASGASGTKQGFQGERAPFGRRRQTDLAADDGDGEDWQALLWRMLIGESADSRDRRIRALIRNVDRSQVSVQELDAVWLFGISTMAPCLLSLVHRLGVALPVRLYVRNPSPAYWLDDPTPAARTQMRLRIAEQDESSLPDDDVAGNPVLAANGGLVRDFMRELLELADQNLDADNWIDPSDERLFDSEAQIHGRRKRHLLGALQADVFLAVDGRDYPVAQACRQRVLAGEDQSLRFHCCHNRMREMEVLRDWLLNWFDGGRDRHPRQIVVTAPDIESYVPYIEAVFNRPGPRDATYVPYTIADRSAIAESAVVQAFFQLLDLPKSRLRISEVFDLLGIAPIAAAIEVAPEEVSTLRRWCAAVNIRWGLDGEHRAALGFPALGEVHSWRFGLDRMLAGYALAGNADPLAAGFNNLAPYDQIEGQNAALLGKLGAFIQALAQLRDNLETPAVIGCWQSRLTRVIDTFFVDNDDDAYASLAALRRAISDLARRISDAEVTEAIPVAAIAAALQANAENKKGTGSFCRGAVTFCSMLPMRSIPADVVWLLGMNDADYPRQEVQRDFNRIQQGKRRNCDRSRRLDDRYMFLEAITSARHQLHVSYHGRSDKDNAVRPPSALVRELRDYLLTKLGLSDSDPLTTEYPLHPFSLRYFDADEPAVFTYDPEAREDAVQLCEFRKQPILPDYGLTQIAPLPPPPEDSDLLPPAEHHLARFYRNPAAFWMRHRLGVYLRDEEDPTSDEETIDLEILSQYALRTRLAETLAPAVASGDAATLAQRRQALANRLRQEGALPVGAAGDARLAEETAFVTMALAVEVCGDRNLAQLLIDPDAMHLGGRVHLRYRFSEIKGKDRMAGLVAHLCRNVEQPNTTILVGAKRDKNGEVETGREILVPAVDDDGRRQAAADLAVLTRYYEQGLLRPLLFSPGASFEFAEATHNKRKKNPVGNTDGVWFGTSYKPSFDGIADPANRFCFGAESLCGRPRDSILAVSADTCDSISRRDTYYTEGADQGSTSRRDATDTGANLGFEDIALAVYALWLRWRGEGTK